MCATDHLMLILWQKICFAWKLENHKAAQVTGTCAALSACFPAHCSANHGCADAVLPPSLPQRLPTLLAATHWGASKSISMAYASS